MSIVAIYVQERQGSRSALHRHFLYLFVDWLRAHPSHAAPLQAFQQAYAAELAATGEQAAIMCDMQHFYTYMQQEFYSERVATPLTDAQWAALEQHVMTLPAEEQVVWYSLCSAAERLTAYGE